MSLLIIVILKKIEFLSMCSLFIVHRVIKVEIELLLSIQTFDICCLMFGDIKIVIDFFIITHHR